MKAPTFTGIDYTNGLVVGTLLPNHKAVIRAAVHRKGVLCTFRGIISKAETRKVIPITADEYSDWVNGTSIQYAMPGLSADTRELFLTGEPELLA